MTIGIGNKFTIKIVIAFMSLILLMMPILIAGAVASAPVIVASMVIEWVTDWFDVDVDQRTTDWFNNEYPSFSAYTTEDVPQLYFAEAISCYYYVGYGYSLFDSNQTYYMTLDQYIYYFQQDYTEEEIYDFLETYTGNALEDDSSVPWRADMRKNISTLTSKFKSASANGINGSVEMLDYPEDTYLPYSSAECQSLWSTIVADINANLSISKTYTNSMQCTTFANWRLWKYTGHGVRPDGTHGNGSTMAKNLADNYPEEYELSYTPKAGAIFSAGGITGQHNHVGFVEKVEGDIMWISDGNINGGGIRINYRWNIDYFNNTKYGGDVIYAIPKT